MGEFFARYGVAATIGRVFALLLTSDAPLSLDEIAAWLGTSKSGISVAARDLERLGLVRRQLTRGSRRILFEASDDMAAVFEAQFTRIREQRGLFVQAEPLLGSERARRRLQRILELHDFWLTRSARILNDWRNR